MKINIYAVGKSLPDWVEEGIDVYARRLPAPFGFKIHTIAPSRAATAPLRQKEEEAFLLKPLESKHILIVCDERGRLLNNTELKDLWNKWLTSARDVSFVIGGADGLTQECRQQADLVWSLSPLTLPHALVRLFITEQIYRTWTMVQNHPYHRE